MHVDPEPRRARHDRALQPVPLGRLDVVGDPGPQLLRLDQRDLVRVAAVVQRLCARAARRRDPRGGPSGSTRRSCRRSTPTSRAAAPGRAGGTATPSRRATRSRCRGSGRRSRRGTRGSATALHGGQPVDALGVLLRDVLVEAAVAHLLVDPRVVLRALALELHERDAVAARVGDALDVDADHRAHRVCGRVEARRRARGPAGSTSARPCSRTIFGGPSNAQNMTTMRPFSRACAIVSAPLPTKSRYATSVGPRIRNQRRSPFGDTLTCPSVGERRRRDEEEMLPLDPGGRAARRSPSRPSPRPERNLRRMDRAVKVACAQVEPVVLDLERTLDRLEEARGRSGAERRRARRLPGDVRPRLPVVALGEGVRRLAERRREADVRAARAELGRRRLARRAPARRRREGARHLARHRRQRDRDATARARSTTRSSTTRPTASSRSTTASSCRRTTSGSSGARATDAACTRSTPASAASAA